MKITTVMKTGLAIAVCGTLAACGGSSDDDSGSPVTESLQVDPMNYGNSPVAIRNIRDFAAASAVYDETLEMQDWLDEVGYLLEQHRYGAGYGDTTAEHCLEENDNFFVEEEFSETHEYYKYQLVDCLVPGYGEPLRLNGTYVYDETSNPDGTRFQSQETFDIRGELEDRSQQIAITGSMRAEASFQPNDDGTYIVSTPRMEYLIGDVYLALQGSRIQVSERGDLDRIDMQAKLISSALGGYLNLSTPTAIEELYYENCPRKGHVVVSGDGKIEARYGESAGRGYGLEILLNGSQVEYSDTCDIGVGSVGNGNSSVPLPPSNDGTATPAPNPGSNDTTNPSQ